jgi:hypothetical protein
MGYREDDEKRIKEWKDLRESGLVGGPSLPSMSRKAWIISIIVAVWVVGLVIGIVNGSLFGSTTPRTKAPPATAAPPAPGSPNHIDTIVPNPRRATIDGQGGRKVRGVASTPDTRVCTYDHGETVTVWKTVGDMAQVSSGCPTWVPIGNLKMLD